MPSIYGTTPDYRRILTVLKNERPDRVPLYEFFSDINIQRRVLEDHKPDSSLSLGDNDYMNEVITGQYYLGYDYINPGVGFGFKGMAMHDSVDAQGIARRFLDDANAPIKTRADFEKVVWPTVEDIDFTNLEYCSKYVPEGMKVIANLGGGLLEWAMWLTGTDHFCMLIYDDPELVRDLISALNDQQVAVARNAASAENVIACALGDDLGFKTQTFLPPAMLREYVFPGLKRIVDEVHKAGKLFILHSCGNLTEVMDDLVDYVGIDAKHSFEDVIMPVSEVQKRWGHKVSLLGGIDIDVLSRAPEDELRAYVRRVISQCRDQGGFAVGSGNSIANYIPPKNLWAMNDEAIRCQK